MTDKPPPLNFEPINTPSQEKEQLIKKCQYHWEEWLKAASALSELSMKQNMSLNMMHPQHIPQTQHMSQPPNMRNVPNISQNQPSQNSQFTQPMYPSMYNYFPNPNWNNPNPNQKWPQ